MKHLLIAIILLSFFLSCNTVLCGKLKGEWKSQYEKANTVAVNMKVEYIPCEYFYINVFLNNKNIDTSYIRSIHKYLYNEKTKVGWPVLQIYNEKGKYLFSLNYEGSCYVQKGD